VPWNNAELKQAIGRVHRISQTKPVEVVTFVPRRSVTAAKLKAHEDKRDRLEPAMRDEDFSNFTAAEESQWKLRAQITMSLSTLDTTGNYKMTAEQARTYFVWQTVCAAATAAGQPHPACPAECMLPTPLRANDVVLPPVSYPVEGFVEPSVASGSKRSMDSDSDSDSDEEIEYSKFNGKRRMIDSSSEPLTVEARLKMLRELTGANANSSSDEETENDDDDDEDETEEEDGDDEDE
jgi:hypothetical protein